MVDVHIQMPPQSANSGSNILPSSPLNFAANSNELSVVNSGSYVKQICKKSNKIIGVSMEDVIIGRDNLSFEDVPLASS